MNKNVGQTSEANQEKGVKSEKANKCNPDKKKQTTRGWNRSGLNKVHKKGKDTKKSKRKNRSREQKCCRQQKG